MNTYSAAHTHIIAESPTTAQLVSSPRRLLNGWWSSSASWRTCRQIWQCFSTCAGRKLEKLEANQDLYFYFFVKAFCSSSDLAGSELWQFFGSKLKVPSGETSYRSAFSSSVEANHCHSVGFFCFFFKRKRVKGSSAACWVCWSHEL